MLEANTNYGKLQPEGLKLDRAYGKEDKEVESIFNCRQCYSSTYIRVGSGSPELTRKNDVQAISLCVPQLVYQNPALDIDYRG